MKICVAGHAASPRAEALVAGLLARAGAMGHEVVGEPSHARLVLNLTDADNPRAHWRRDGIHQFAVSILPLAGLSRDGRIAPASDILARAYPALLRTLSNAVVAVGDDCCALVTPELGVRPLEEGGDGCVGSALEAMLPLAATTFAIANEIAEDLPPSLADSPALSDLRDGGRRLASLGLLPSVVRMDEVLTPADLKLLRAVFGIQQISYGNVSVREPLGGFWMTGRGVDKARIEVIGRDALLVASHDEAAGLLRCRVPRGMGESRVSVDALEHALLYEAFAGIGAIVHAHAWIDGIDSTLQNWPCGTVELSREVRDLVSRQPDPCAAEVGLRNHGVTLTGPDVATIFARVEGRLRREVPAA